MLILIGIIISKLYFKFLPWPIYFSLLIPACFWVIRILIQAKRDLKTESGNIELKVKEETKNEDSKINEILKENIIKIKYI